MFVVDSPLENEIKDVCNNREKTYAYEVDKKFKILFPIFKLIGMLQKVNSDYFDSDNDYKLILTNHVIKMDFTHRLDKIYTFHYLGESKKDRKRILKGTWRILKGTWGDADLRFCFHRSYDWKGFYLSEPDKCIINLKHIDLIQGSINELTDLLKSEMAKLNYQTDKKKAETDLLLDKATFVINT